VCLADWCVNEQTALRARCLNEFSGLPFVGCGQPEGVEHVYWRRCSYAAYYSVSCFPMAMADRLRYFGSVFDRRVPLRAHPAS
jgi:hypothetical protein